MPTNVEYILKGCCLRKIKAWCNKGLEREGTYEFFIGDEE